MSQHQARGTSPTIVIVPGLRDHVAEHWQTLLEQKLPRAVCVPRLERDKLSCAAWVDTLERTLAGGDGPVVLIAHRAGAVMTARGGEGVGVRFRVGCSRRRRTSSRRCRKAIRRRRYCARTAGYRRRGRVS